MEKYREILFFKGYFMWKSVLKNKQKHFPQEKNCVKSRTLSFFGKYCGKMQKDLTNTIFFYIINKAIGKKSSGGGFS